MQSKPCLEVTLFSIYVRKERGWKGKKVNVLRFHLKKSVRELQMNPKEKSNDEKTKKRENTYIIEEINNKKLTFYRY